ncbi:MAG: hypothetical protein METHAR1v1_10005 [Methanothrix sp.]|nr:MAG: hypothetical protein METHAR1v1_10005 [Methanothrix sp.]
MPGTTEKDVPKLRVRKSFHYSGFQLAHKQLHHANSKFPVLKSYLLEVDAIYTVAIPASSVSRPAQRYWCGGKRIFGV